ncbi:hypothetical protein DESAMIL20_1066 [Desulfurella amilsii]|uniref:Uncharacterized protein n=1 Tax=Desulfurella amilsii TaxID=1562698 RepID=A0A1X4XVD1_9BACT|nr:type I-B CRISPR-associated protein Cas8b1/Cst1 [Desulfurella amilsii]OSS41513.1 hypothetical protein DESAMIL20_1066 [Desulfurella amilsii]
MKEKVFLRDWYYNAGIIGFLKIICNGDFDKLEDFGDKLHIDENYIEFDLEILDNFKEKLYEQLFLKYFDLNQYQSYINKALKDNEALKDKKDKQNPLITRNIDKYPFQGLYESLGHKLETYDDLVSYQKTINEYTKERIYDETKTTDFITDFVKKVTKGIIGLSNLEKYLKDARDNSFKLEKDSDKPCISCQIRKRKFEFNNAISNIIGFNKDNANWIWGFNSTKVQLCSICSLIYLSASVSLIFHKKGGNYINCFYFINNNRNISRLKESYIEFEKQVNSIKTQEIYPIMVKEAVKFTKQEQAAKSLQNISFIESQENNMSGQSTKNYNVYSFSLTSKLAEFIDNNIDKIPTGSYTNKNNYFDIEYEVLRKTIEKKLYYDDINRYLRMYLSSKNKNTNLNFKADDINKVVNYILKYITYMLKGGVNVDLEKISKTGYVNGKKLRNKLSKEGRENQINGFVYQFLNDLRVGDKDRFLDKYLRISISNELELYFGLEEMNNKEAFLHFGYSFLNGLLYQQNNSTKENENE